MYIHILFCSIHTIRTIILFCSIHTNLLYSYYSILFILFCSIHTILFYLSFSVLFMQVVMPGAYQILRSFLCNCGGGNDGENGRERGSSSPGAVATVSRRALPVDETELMNMPEMELEFLINDTDARAINTKYILSTRESNSSISSRSSSTIAAPHSSPGDASPSPAAGDRKAGGKAKIAARGGPSGTHGTSGTCSALDDQQTTATDATGKDRDGDGDGDNTRNPLSLHTDV